MKSILLLTFIIYIKSFISSYYSSCINPPKGRFSSIGKNECQKHNQTNSYCCLLSYYIRNANHKEKTRYEECIGISKLGYDQINDVINDVNEDKNLDDQVSIDCTSKSLGFFYIFLLLFILNIN